MPLTFPKVNLPKGAAPHPPLKRTCLKEPRRLTCLKEPRRFPP